DIVLQSESKITLKMGGSFIVIHPGGVDITGLKINLNGGGSPGTPVKTLQAAVLSRLSDEDDSADEPPEDEDGSYDDSCCGNDSGEKDEPSLNHMLASLKGMDGIQSKELIFNAFFEGDME
ncbi:MAG: type VI secretion system tip protein VgrG, partial [Buttiauxella sp.]